MTEQTAQQTETESPPLVLSQQVGKTLHLTLNNPKTLNSLSLDMICTLTRELDHVMEDRKIHAVIIKGAGKGFCAGHDLKEINKHRQDVDHGEAYYRTLFNNCSTMMLKITALPVPVIAEVHGVAAAAGCQLVASCDLAVASQETIFAVNGIDSGLFCTTPQVPLSRNIPRKAALEMLMLGERIDAARAEQLGLINAAVKPGTVAVKAQEFADKVGEKSRAVIALGKAAFYRQIDMDLASAYEDMSRTIVDNLMMPDAICGIDAFVKKQKPKWEDAD